MTRMPANLTVVFDLDGTLVDTAPDLIGTLRAVLKNAGHELEDGPHLRSMVGKGARYLIEEGLRETGATWDETKLNGLFDDFIAHYGANIDRHSRPFDGVIDMLTDFQAQGVKLGVCTNKPEVLSRKLLTSLDMLKFFPAVLGADTLPVRKPDPAHLTQTIAALGGDENRAIMVGDSITDVDTAKAAGIPVIVVDFGYTAIPPAELGGDALVSHTREIPEAILTLLPGA